MMSVPLLCGVGQLVPRRVNLIGGGSREEQAPPLRRIWLESKRVDMESTPMVTGV